MKPLLAWPAAALLCLSLTACPQEPVPVTPVAPTEPPVVIPAPTRLSAQTVTLGAARSVQATQAFSGSWRVQSAPDWLRVSTPVGSGAVSLTLTADRALAASPQAATPTLQGELILAWTSGTASGTATWTVTADLYTLTGRVAEAGAAPLAVQARDVSVQAAQETAAAPAAQGVIVRLKAPLTASSRTALHRQGVDLSGVQPLDSGQLQTTSLLLDIAPAALPETLAALRADPAVLYAVPNATLSLHSATSLHSASAPAATPPPTAALWPTDPYAGLQWASVLLGYGAVWRDMQAGGYTRPVTVAVIDSGVRFDHPDLAGGLWTSGEGALDLITDATNGDGDGPDTDPTDPTTPERVRAQSEDSHGTHVTGIIAARWNTLGVAGASGSAPIKVLPLRVVNTRGTASLADVALALRYAAGLPLVLNGGTVINPHPAQVINLSLGTELSAADAVPLCEAVAQAQAAGSLVVASAGNTSGTAPVYPAACAGAVAVGSVSLSGASAPRHAAYSAAYTQVALSAPGGSDPRAEYLTSFNGGRLNGATFPDLILSTDWNYGRDEPAYRGRSGTSQAAPQVSALAALLLSKGLTTGPADTLARLSATATDLGAVGRDPLFGVGMINPSAALNAPAVSRGFGLRLQDAQGHAFQPALDALGRFTASLPDGIFSVVAGQDLNGNGIYGEAGESPVTRRAELGPAQTRLDLGTLTVGP